MEGEKERKLDVFEDDDEIDFVKIMNSVYN